MSITPRSKILELEKQNKWVFHGSGIVVEKLEPRQAFSSKIGTRIPDGKPAVFATPNADIAIFMAIFSKENIVTDTPGKHKSGFSANSDGIIEFRVTKDLMDKTHGFKGYVYVLDRKEFKSRSSFEVLSHNSVKPDGVIVVTEQDLPKNIEIKDF